jgi:hypothetical protein
VIAAATPWGWAHYQDHHYDIAVGKLDQPLPGPFLKVSPGGETPPKECTVLGYAFGGAQLWQCTSHDLRWNQRGGQISASMSEGCSGGPWLVKRGRSYQSVGITSRGGDGFLLSPAWGKAVVNLLEWAAEQA